MGHVSVYGQGAEIGCLVALYKDHIFGLYYGYLDDDSVQFCLQMSKGKYLWINFILLQAFC